MKRGISQVVTTLLFVLIALGAVLLVWNLVRGIITQSSEDIDVTQFNLKYSLEGKNVYVNEPQEKISFVVKRDAGTGETYGFNVILEDESGQSKNFPSDVIVNELESKIINIDYSGSGLGEIAKISIAPILKTDSGKEKVGNILAEAVIADERRGSAVSFDGVNGRVEVLNSDSLNINGNGKSLAVSAWIKVNGLKAIGWSEIVSKYAWPNYGYDLLIVDSVGSLYFYTYKSSTNANSAYNLGVSKIVDGKWHNVIGVYDNSAQLMKLYWDGMLVRSNNVPLDWFIQDNSGKNLWIGDSVNNGADSRVLNGEIDDVRIYNKVLSDEDISKLYNAGFGDSSGSVSEGLVGWWRFDEGSGTTAKDSSGNGNDGILMGNVEWI